SQVDPKLLKSGQKLPAREVLKSIMVRQPPAFLDGRSEAERKEAQAWLGRLDRLMQSSSHSIVSPEEYARAGLARERAIARGDRADPRTQFVLRMMDDAEDPMPRRIGLPALAFKTSGSAVEGRPPQVLRPRGDAVIGRDFDQLAAKK